jgi:hypothetical protein
LQSKEHSIQHPITFLQQNTRSYTSRNSKISDKPMRGLIADSLYPFGSETSTASTVSAQTSNSLEVLPKRLEASQAK